MNLQERSRREKATCKTSRNTAQVETPPSREIRLSAPDSPETLLTVVEAAEFLRISRHLAYLSW